MTIEEAQEIDARASVVMKRGMSLMQAQRQAEVGEALVCFDEALALRRHLPLDGPPAFRYSLAACWLNRAEALLVIGGPSQIEAALDAFDEAIALLHELPLSLDPLYPRRLAIAHQNRGLTLSALAPPRVEAAAVAFTHAINLLNDSVSDSIEDRPYLLGAAWVNLARIRTMQKDATVQDVRDAAVTALEQVAELETSDLGGAEVGLTARHLLCQALARMLPNVSPNDPDGLELVHAATDTVDEGLDVVRSWESRGVGRFRGAASDLLRFGARVYRSFQPHFLEEFIEDQLDPSQSSADYVASAEIQAAAADVRSLAV
jgi:tetratricopeptide (TPR) repeat protein